MITYNLTQYFENELGAWNFQADGFYPDTAETAISLNQVDLGNVGQMANNEYVIRVLSRSRENYTAKKRAESVKDFCRQRNGCVLPTVVVGGDTITGQTVGIYCNQGPTDIGPDDSGRYRWVLNIQVFEEV